jgi:hypothetical protein
MGSLDGPETALGSDICQLNARVMLAGILCGRTLNMSMAAAQGRNEGNWEM